MRLEDLLRVVLDPLAGGEWPQGQEDLYRPRWYEGQIWAVEYRFTRPALSLDSLPFGDEVAGTYRYEVLRRDETPAGDFWVVEVTPCHRHGSNGTRYLCRYQVEDLKLVEAQRFVAGEERPLELGSFPSFPAERRVDEDDERLERVVRIDAAQLVEQG